MNPYTRLRDDDGFSALETALLAPVVLLMIVALIYVSRTASVAASIEGAAYAGARAASLERTAGPASAAASKAAQASLDSAGISCTPTVQADTAGFSAAVGVQSQVRVHIACQISYTDLGVPGVPGARTMTAQALSPIDAYRSRS